jgi:IS1 family transposase
MTFVERITRCIVGWRVVEQRDLAIVQQLVDQSPPAKTYYSDQFASYGEVVYDVSQQHLAMPDKSQTYSVEGVNADLRHYLARLRRRSRCFSRSLRALIAAVKLFVFAHNRRQLYRLRFPDYPAHLMDFAL